MITILKYLKGHGKAVIIIFALIIIQVLCDLALPQYTSELVDVGIQQKGIEDNVPEYIRGETLDNITLLINDEEAAEVKSAYIQSEDYDGVYEFDGDSEVREKINDVLKMPFAVLYMDEQSPEINIQALEAAIESGAVSKDEIIEKMNEEIKEYSSDSLVSQAAISYIGKEYEKAGIDVNEIQMNYLWHKAFQMLLVTIIMVGTAIGISYFASRTGAQVGRDLRKEVFTKVSGFGRGEMDKFSTASLITRSTNDIQQVQMVLVIILRMVAYAPVMGIGACIKVALTNTGMGWVTAVAVGLIFVIIGTLVLIAMPKFKIMQTLVDKVNLVSREIITGIPVIRAFSREEYEKERFAKASRDLMKTQIFTHRTMSFMGPFMMFVMNGISVLIVWQGTKGVDNGTMQVGDMMAFITYTMMIVAAFMMLAMVAVFAPRAAVAAGRIKEVIDTESSVKDKDNTVTLDNPRGRIAFENVAFRYPGATDNVIENISFVAEPGKTTAIIGSTGSGKSTLINLVPRFYDVTEGRITIDDIDIRDLKQHDLREVIGYVPQKGILFSGDIRSNICFGGNNIEDNEMKEAAETAQASDFIEDMPQGYDTHVAQGGTNVSGGQKQRISIARAIAKNPKVFIFDDSFSALDFRTDAALRKNLSEKTKEATVLIVAQRIATIMNADQIVVLDEGKIMGIGTHYDLMNSCETYREIAGSQLSEEELARGGNR